jgi:pyruvate decarboxylase
MFDLIGAVRHKVIQEAEELVKKTGFPYFATSMGKGAMTESLSSFGGVYGGSGSLPEIKKAVESSDFVLWIGNYPVCLVYPSNWIG